MIELFGPRDCPGSEVYQFLDSSQVARSGPAPDREAVKDMWENVGLDEELPGLGCKVMPNFI